ncbi:MAG: hypothetical protein IJB15_12740 [Clostridia bacterium]|nr:hypothetical protein [Clostridia bacterium]
MNNHGNNAPGAFLTGYRIAEIVLCLVVILVGVLYLYTDIVSLWLLLPVFLAVFIAIPVLRYLDERKRGIGGLALGLSVGIAALPAVVVIVAIMAYLGM